MKKWIFRIISFLLLFALLSVLSFYFILEFTSPEFVMRLASFFRFFSRESYYNAFINAFLVLSGTVSIILIVAIEFFLKKKKVKE